MKKIILLTLLSILFTGCSIVNKSTANLTANLLSDASKAFNAEPDMKIAEVALPSNLKLMEGILETIPNNETVLITLAQGYCSLGFGFLEDSENKLDVERAKAVYIRGYKYGRRALDEDLSKALESGTLDEVEREVAKTGKSDVAALFWTGYCLGDWVNLNKDDVNAVADLAKVELVMRRVKELNENFYNGSVHTFYGVYYGSRPKMLGGNPEKAREHFEKALTISNNKFLLPKLFLAQFYAVPTQNEKLFDESLKEVINAPVDLYPEERLANQIAKKRALKLLADKANLF